MGVLKLASGAKYEGMFAKDKANFRGVMTYVNKDKYDGEWADGMRSGKGVYYYEDGNTLKLKLLFLYFYCKYEGEWANDEKVYLFIIFIERSRVIFGLEWGQILR